MSYRILQFPTFSAADTVTGGTAPSRAKVAASKLRQAAALVEVTAFEEAGEQPTPVISQLIMLSADLERLAQTIERGNVEH